MKTETLEKVLNVLRENNVNTFEIDFVNSRRVFRAGNVEIQIDTYNEDKITLCRFEELE